MTAALLAVGSAPQSLGFEMLARQYYPHRLCKRNDIRTTRSVSSSYDTRFFILLCEYQCNQCFSSHASLLYSLARRYGYGFGALEHSYYDSKEMIFYGGSQLGFVTISDYQNYPNVTQAHFGIDLDNTLTDIEVCGHLLFITTKGNLNPGKLSIYNATKCTCYGGTCNKTNAETPFCTDGM